MRYLALLRGINVNGHRLIPMADLRRLCADLGYADVQTFIQSGNVVLTAPAPAGEVAVALGAAIAARFGFDVPVVVLSLAELEALHSANPFVLEDLEPRALHVTVFAEAPSADRAQALDWERFRPERGAVAGRWLYLYCPNGYHTARLNNGFFERTLGVPATTRNWQTIGRLWRLASAPV